MSESIIEEISVTEAACRLQSGNDIKLLDVREPFEYELAHIDGSTLVTQVLVEEIIASWPKDTPIILQCHHGFRSMQAALFFQQQGFTQLANMSGGIDAWSVEIDTTIDRY